MNKSILIIGGTGFFGKSLLDYAREKSLAYDITILSRHAKEFIEKNQNILPKNISFIQGDVRTFEIFQHFDYMIHAATPASTKIDDSEMTSITVDGMKNVISMARRTGCKKILFTSSGAAYGPYDRAMSEEDICNPVTAYGKGKLESEKMLAESGLNYVVARCFAFAGKFLNKDIHFAIGNFVKDAMSGKDIVINSDGRSIRSYLDQEDLCYMLFTLLEKARNRSIYNVGSPFPISIADLAYKVKNVLGSKSNVKILGKTEKDNSRSVYYPDMSKFYKDFQFNDYISLEKSIKNMFFK